MAKNTSILLGEYFENFINKQVKSGRFNSASEVERTALRLSEQEEARKKILINELKSGEKSGLFHSSTENNILRSFMPSMQTYEC